MDEKQKKPASSIESGIVGFFGGVTVAFVLVVMLSPWLTADIVKTAWHQGFTIGMEALGERSARQRNDLPVADWYKNNRALHPAFDLDPTFTKEVIEGK